MRFEFEFFAQYLENIRLARLHRTPLKPQNLHRYHYGKELNLSLIGKLKTAIASVFWVCPFVIMLAATAFSRHISAPSHAPTLPPIGKSEIRSRNRRKL